MLYMLEVSVPCETPTILRLFMILGKIINIVKLIVPIILVVIATIEVAKMVLDSEEKISKSIKLVSNKFIAAILIFFVPPIVSFLLGSFVPSVAICYDNANIETISYFEQIERDKKEAIRNTDDTDDNEDDNNHGGGITIPDYGSSKTTLVVATWNIGRGTKQRNVTAARLARKIKENNIDVIGIQEAKNNGAHLISSVADKNNMKYYYTGTPAGNALLSKNQFSSKNYYSLVSCGERRALQKIIVNINGINVSFYNVHISYQKKCRKKQIKDVYDKVKNDPNPFVLVGDFNVATQCSIIRDIFGTKYPIVARDTINNGIACTDSIIVSSDKISVISSKTIKTKGTLSDHNMIIASLEIRK